MENKTDFTAYLNFLPTESGGRKTAAKSGYRPQVEFEFTKITSSGSQNYIGRDLVFPGENILAEIRILSPQFFLKVNLKLE